MAKGHDVDHTTAAAAASSQLAGTNRAEGPRRAGRHGADILAKSGTIACVRGGCSEGTPRAQVQIWVRARGVRVVVSAPG